MKDLTPCVFIFLPALSAQREAYSINPAQRSLHSLDMGGNIP